MKLKITKTAIYHLIGHREPCGCMATREYLDPQYRKPANDKTDVVLCPKHKEKSEDAQEILTEMMVEELSQAAEEAGKQYVAARQVEAGDSGGVVATGESVQAMGVSGLPKRGEVRPRQKKDPLAITQVSVDRSDQKLPQKAAVPATVPIDDSDVTITGDIDTVPEDPRLTSLAVAGLDELEETLDEMDMKDAGVPRSALSQAKD